jgi:hypothetical protein
VKLNQQVLKSPEEGKNSSCLKLNICFLRRAPPMAVSLRLLWFARQYWGAQEPMPKNVGNKCTGAQPCEPLSQQKIGERERRKPVEGRKSNNAVRRKPNGTIRNGPAESNEMKAHAYSSKAGQQVAQDSPGSVQIAAHEPEDSCCDAGVQEL